MIENESLSVFEIFNPACPNTTQCIMNFVLDWNSLNNYQVISKINAEFLVAFTFSSWLVLRETFRSPPSTPPTGFPANLILVKFALFLSTLQVLGSFQTHIALFNSKSFPFKKITFLLFLLFWLFKRISISSLPWFFRSLRWQCCCTKCLTICIWAVCRVHTGR